MINVDNLIVVCFASSFRQDGSRGGVETLNVSHAALGNRTLCGRREWMTDEGGYEHNVGVDCRVCAKAIERALMKSKEPCDV